MFFFNLIANNKYPFKASRTCCHGLVEFGFLTKTFLFFDQDFTESGISRSSDQSPPPTTFPALAIPINTFVFLAGKYEVMYDWNGLRWIS